MLRSLVGFFLAVFIASSALAQPVIGEAAPDFKGLDAITGKPIHLADFKGKPVVLEWQQFNCPFIRKYYSVGAMQQLQTRAHDSGVVWITINSSAEGKDGFLKTAAEAKAALAADKSHTAHYILDHAGTIGHLYGAKTTPHMFVIDAAGILQYMGAIDNMPTADSADIATATNYVTLALQAIQDGTPVKTPYSKPYGCFVKY